ncbi:HrcA family transcriptional regulator [Patescibacteria group bacterium]
MNERQEKILSAVIEEYTNSAIPVGSKILSQKYNLEASSATIRSNMVALENDGYLYQPHISAGRIPTDKGYRYFVESLMEDRELEKREQIELQEELLKLRAQNVRLSRTSAKLLSGISKSLAISGVLGEQEFHDFGMKELLNEPEFRELDEVCRLAEALDYVDEMFEKIISEMETGETKIFIGNENPIDKISNCSMIVSPYELGNGEKGVLALIGPKRMEYAKNKSLIEYVKKILGTSAFLIIITNTPCI